MRVKAVGEASPAPPAAAAPAAPSTTTKAKKPQKPRSKPSVAKSKTPTKAPSPPIQGKKRKQPSKTTSTATAKGAAAAAEKKKSSKPAPPTAKKAKQEKSTTTASTAPSADAATDATASKEDKKQGKNVGGRPRRDIPDVDPYKQISVLGLPPAPVIVLARREDVTTNFKKSFPLAPRKSRAKPRPFTGLPSMQPGGTSTATAATPTATVNGSSAPSGATTNPNAATGDARVALRVIPGGQIPPRFKRPNGTKDDSAATKKAKTKSARPSSAAATTAAASSGIAAFGNYTNRSKLSPEWHPGMHTVNGITLVEPNRTNVLPPHPIVQGGRDPPRYRPMNLTATDFPEFDQEDGSRASIQYLRYIAMTVGRINSTLPGRLQNSLNGEQKVFKDRLTRVLLARDGRHADKVRAGGTRRSTRTRFAPDVFIPTTADGGRISAFGYRRGEGFGGDGEDGDYEIGAGGVMIQPFDPTELTDVRVGPMYQTELPQQRRRPSAPEKEESRWVENLVLEAGKAVHSNRVERTESMTRACEDTGHAEAIACQVSQLAETVGPAVAEAFGLGTMGTETARNLTEEQQEQLYRGITQHGRGFFKISKEFLGGDVRPRVLAAYYYDVWKLAGIPAAKRWFADKAEEEERRIAEEKAQELLRAEEAARRSKSMEASHRRRQVKEAVQWVRASSKIPHEANFNKSVVRERISRILRVQRDLVEAVVAPLPVAISS